MGADDSFHHTSSALFPDDVLEATRQATSLSLGAILANQARNRPNAVAIVDGCRSLTYKEFHLQTNRLSHGLLAQGVRPGDRIAILSGNSLEFALAIFASAKIGAAVAALNWRLHSNEIRFAINLVEPTLLMVSHEYSELMRTARVGEQELPLLFLDNGPCATEGNSFLGIGSTNDAEPRIDIDPEAIAVIVYTSGTTGVPKAAAISHRAMFARAIVVGMELSIDAGDTYIAWAPMFHIAGADFLFIMSILGGKFVILPGYDPKAIVDLVISDKIGWLCLMPGTFEPVIELLQLDTRPVNGVKVVGSLADLVSPETIGTISGLVNAPFYNSFGCTEIGFVPAVGLIPPGEIPTDLSKPLSPLCDIRLVDPEDKDVPDQVPGELLFRGPTVFSGYWNNAEATRTSFRGGWFHTGDILQREKNGHLSFASRSKYLIKSGGENIYPAEIERVLIGHPDVAEVVVVREPHNRWGEVPVAVIAPKATTPDADEIITYCRERMAHFKVPTRVVFMDIEQFPRNVTGKVVREEIERAIVQTGVAHS